MSNAASHSQGAFEHMTESQIQESLQALARIAFDRYELRGRLSNEPIVDVGLAVRPSSEYSKFRARN